MSRATARAMSTVSSGADITAESDGIHVRKAEATGTAGDISIATTGGAITVEEQPGSGIYVRDSYARKGSTAIVNAADITAFDVGIHVSGSDRGRSSVRDRQEVGGDITVTHRGGTVLSRWQSGIVARSKPFNDVGDVTIAAMGGTVQSAGWGTAAIRAVGRGLGDAIVTIAAGATAISFKDAGVLASLFKDARLGSADNSGEDRDGRRDSGAFGRLCPGALQRQRRDVRGQRRDGGGAGGDGPARDRHRLDGQLRGRDHGPDRPERRRPPVRGVSDRGAGPVPGCGDREGQRRRLWRGGGH